MKVTTPTVLIVNTAKVTSNIVERDTVYDPADWVSTTGYIEGNQVYRSTTSKIYQSLSVTLTTNAVVPETDVLAAVPKWVEISYCNKWKMFDYTRNAFSYRSSNITVDITPGLSVDTVGVIGLSGCTSITITATSGGVNVYNPSATPYAPGGNIDNYIIYDMSPASNVIIRIVLSGPAVVGCMSCITGKSENLGNLQSDVLRDNINFSSIDRDTYGTATIIKRRSISKTTYSLSIAAAEIARVIRVRDDLNAITALWNGMSDNSVPAYYNSLIILGFYRNFSIQLDNSVVSTISLELEEL